MDIPDEVQKKIHTFSEQCLKNEKRQAESPLDPINVGAYNRSLEETLRNLQDRVQQQEAALQNVCLRFLWISTHV